MSLRTLLTSSSFLATTAGVVATAAVGTAGGDYGSRWYRRLRKPPFDPPAIVFPIVWPLLYADIAVASAAVLEAARAAANHRAHQSYAAALGANLVLNATWTPVATRSRHVWLSAAQAGALAVSSWDLVRRAAPLHQRAAVALTPYAAWCTFATVLSTDLARRNT